jgi:hypothetical protein
MFNAFQPVPPTLPASGAETWTLNINPHLEQLATSHLPRTDQLTHRHDRWRARLLPRYAFIVTDLRVSRVMNRQCTHRSGLVTRSWLRKDVSGTRVSFLERPMISVLSDALHFQGSANGICRTKLTHSSSK